MKKNRLPSWVLPGLMIGAFLMLSILGLRPAAAIPVAPVLNFSPVQPLAVSPPPAPVNQPPLLDARRQSALGMIETGNRDSQIGGAGEVSRYQIMPSVWKQYSRSQQYRDPQVSLAVARQHWSKLSAGFQKQAHREPNDFDMYVLWNTRYGYYAAKGFNPARLAVTVRERAQRFVNLVNSDD